MNEHLQPVFEILPPGLERAGIKYWVYGGIGIAAVVGECFRHNTDVDIFVRDTDFEDARSHLVAICEQNEFTPKDRRPLGKRPKFEVIDRNGREILSVVPVYSKDGVVEFVFGRSATPYSDQMLERMPRDVGG